MPGARASDTQTSTKQRLTLKESRASSMCSLLVFSVETRQAVMVSYKKLRLVK